MFELIKQSIRKLIPLFDRVIVKRIKVEQVAQIQGIYVPESTKSKNNPEAEVIAVGDKASLTVGDRVLLPEYDGAKVKFDGDQFDVYREDEIIAKVTQK